MIEDDDVLVDDLIITLKQEFSAVRVMDNRMIPTKWRVKMEVIKADEPEDAEAAEYDFNIRVAFSKIRFWFDQVVSGCVMFERGNEWAQRACLADDGSQSVANHIMLLPGEPTDELICKVLQSKANALSGNFLAFASIELESDDVHCLSYIYNGVGEFELPDHDEWIGEHSYFSKPWWGRDDASTFDVVPDEETDTQRPPDWCKSLDFLEDLMRPPTDTSARIIRPEFRPQVIEGGKSD